VTYLVDSDWVADYLKVRPAVNVRSRGLDRTPTDRLLESPMLTPFSSWALNKLLSDWGQCHDCSATGLYQSTATSEEHCRFPQTAK
jgi:hypothetical protein